VNRNRGCKFVKVTDSDGENACRDRPPGNGWRHGGGGGGGGGRDPTTKMASASTSEIFRRLIAVVVCWNIGFDREGCGGGAMDKGVLVDEMDFFFFYNLHR